MKLLRVEILGSHNWFSLPRSSEALKKLRSIVGEGVEIKYLRHPTLEEIKDNLKKEVEIIEISKISNFAHRDAFSFLKDIFEETRAQGARLIFASQETPLVYIQVEEVNVEGGTVKAKRL